MEARLRRQFHIGIEHEPLRRYHCFYFVSGFKITITRKQNVLARASTRGSFGCSFWRFFHVAPGTSASKRISTTFRNLCRPQKTHTDTNASHLLDSPVLSFMYIFFIICPCRNIRGHSPASARIVMRAAGSRTWMASSSADGLVYMPLHYRRYLFMTDIYGSCLFYFYF